MTCKPTHADDQPTHPIARADGASKDTTSARTRLTPVSSSPYTSGKDTKIDPLAAFRDVEAILRTLAYAELRAVMLAWARVPTRHPSELVRGAIDRAVAEWSASPVSVCTFGETLRAVIRSETARAFHEAVRRAGPVPWERALAPGQIGDAAGIEIIFHEAGDVAARVRANDPRMLSTAVALTDYVRAHARAQRRHVPGMTPP